MKKLLKLVPVAFFGILLAATSCTDNEETINQEPSLSKSVALEEIPEIWPFTIEVNGQTINGELTLNWNQETETANEVLVSTNVLNALDLSQEEFNAKLGDATEGEGYGHADCIAGCNKTFTDENGKRIPGRGACKANCWVDTVIRLIDALPL